MVATTSSSYLPDNQRIVLTGIGLTAPNGNSLGEFRESLLNGRSGVSEYEIRYVGKTLAGICRFDERRYQARKELRRGTRAGSVGIYCSNEAVRDAGCDWENADKSRVGIYLGVTEHGNVETENEIFEIKGYDYDTSFWSHHHNPRTVANNPAGEVALNMGITGPHYTIGAACAAGNAGLIQGAQMLRLNECDLALCGGVSESIRTFGIFASFRSQGALAEHTDPAPRVAAFRSEPQRDRGGRGRLRLYARTAGRRPAARRADLRRTGRIRDEHGRHGLCAAQSRTAGGMRATGVEARGLVPEQIDIVSTHATGTTSGDSQECDALRRVFGGSDRTCFNNTKSFIGHSMGAAGALELAGNLGAFQDKVCHATINVDELDPECELKGLVLNQPREMERPSYVLNNSFGMFGINSVVIVKRF
jgi:3-oxoacyl-[acyl-carrier-protein] synthase II